MKIRDFWIQKEAVAAALNAFVENHPEGRIPSTNSQDDDEKNLAIRVRRQLSHDTHGEFWELLSEKVQRRIVDSELDYRPIQDPKSEAEKIAAQKGQGAYNWASSTRSKRIRDAVRKTFARDSNFLNRFETASARELALSALSRMDQTHIEVEHFFRRAKALPSLYSKSPVKSALALQLRAELGRPRAKILLQKFSIPIQNALERSKEDLDPTRPVPIRLRNFMENRFAGQQISSSGREFFSFDWSHHPATSELQRDLQEIYVKNPRVVEDLQALAEANPNLAPLGPLFISALAPIDRAYQRSLQFLTTKGRFPAAQISLSALRTQARSQGSQPEELEIFLELQKVLEKNPSAYQNLDASFDQTLRKHPELRWIFDRLTQLGGIQKNGEGTADTLHSWKVFKETDEQTIARVYEWIRSTGLPPGFIKPPTGAISLRERGFDPIEIQLIAKMTMMISRPNKKWSIPSLLKAIADSAPSPYDRAMILSLFRSLKLENHLNFRAWSFQRSMKQVRQFVQENNRLPDASKEAALYQVMLVQLKAYPALIDYYPAEVQSLIRATQFWRGIVEKLSN